MVSPSYEDRICAMFDSFSKTASRNYYRDLLRAEKRRNRKYQEEPVDYLLELLGHKDAYPSDSYVIGTFSTERHCCTSDLDRNLFTAHLLVWFPFCTNNGPDCRNPGLLYD